MKKLLAFLLLACLTLGMVPMMSAAESVEVVVNEINFDKTKTVEELAIVGDTERVQVAQDKNKTGMTDAGVLPVAGVPSLEKEGSNQYLRVSDRICNYSGLKIPVASSNMLKKAGQGKYILTFDIKAIKTDKLYFNYMHGDSSKVGERTYYYEDNFVGNKASLRIGVTVNNKGGYVDGTAPGTFRSLQNRGVTDKEMGAQCHHFEEIDKWYTFHYEFEPQELGSVTLNIVGGNWPIQNVDYAIDNIKLVCIQDKEDEVQEDTNVIDSNFVSVPTDVKNEGYEIQGLMLNLDDSRFSAPNAGNYAFMTEEDAIIYIDQYIDTHITDLCLTVNTSYMSMYPSEVWEDQLDEYKKTKSAQTAVWQRYEDMGIDPWQLWIDRLWDNDVNPWLSFRMNDTHGNTTNSILVGDFFWNNLDKYKRIQHRDSNIYRDDRCFDYTYEEPREMWVKYIEEAVTKYDIYGIELDWLRDPIYTTYGDEWADMEILTQFHRDIREAVKKGEEKWGHEIKIAIRCGRDIQSNIEMGFDLITYCAEGLIDVVIPCGYFTTDTEIPVLTWKKILSAYEGIELYPNVTMGAISVYQGNREASDITHYAQNPTQRESVEISSGTAASYFAQGADKLYVFNVFGDSANPITEDQKVTTDKVDNIQGDNLVRWKFQTTVGSYDKVLDSVRRYVLTFQDYAGLWGTSDTQLPKTVTKVDKSSFLYFATGELAEGDTVTLRLGVACEASVVKTMKVYVNGTPAEFTKRVKDTSGLIKDQNNFVYEFKVDASAIRNAALVEMTTTDDTKPYTIVYAELRVDPAVDAE